MLEDFYKLEVRTIIMKKKKMLKIILLGIAVLFIAFIFIICVLFGHELKSLSTLKEKNTGV